MNEDRKEYCCIQLLRMITISVKVTRIEKNSKEGRNRSLRKKKVQRENNRED